MSTILAWGPNSDSLFLKVLYGCNIFTRYAMWTFFDRLDGEEAHDWSLFRLVLGVNFVGLGS